MLNVAECPFCDVDERVLKQNRHANLILSNPRKVPGHFLVIPKRHIEKPWELTEEEVVALFGLITVVQQRLVERFSGGCDIRQNYRPFMRQDRIKVDHVHYHVYPRTMKDDLYQRVERHETDMFEDLSAEEHDEMTRLIE